MHMPDQDSLSRSIHRSPQNPLTNRVARSLRNLKLKDASEANAMIPLSCADYTFPLLARERRLALIALLGFDFVDLGIFERSDGLRPSQLIAEPKKFARQLKRDLMRAGLSVADVFLQTGLRPADSPVNDSDLNVRADNRKKFLLALDLCAEIDCNHLTGLPGFVSRNEDENDSSKRAVEEADWRLRVTSHAGICYAVKPHVESICSNMAEVRSLLDELPGLTLTLDYAQFVSQKICSRDVHDLLPFASHLHVRGGASSKLQTPLERNQIDFCGMVRRLRKSGYKGFLAIAYLRDAWRRCDRTDNLSETILLRRRLAAYWQEETVETDRLPGRPPCTQADREGSRGAPVTWKASSRDGGMNGTQEND